MRPSSFSSSSGSTHGVSRYTARPWAEAASAAPLRPGARVPRLARASRSTATAWRSRSSPRFELLLINTEWGAGCCLLATIGLKPTMTWS